MAGNKLLLTGNKLRLQGNKLRVGGAGDPCCCCSICVDSTWEVALTNVKVEGFLPETDGMPHLYQAAMDPAGGYYKAWGDSSVSGTITTGTGTYSTVGGVKYATWSTSSGLATDVKLEHYPTSDGSGSPDGTYYGTLKLTVVYNCNTKAFTVRVQVVGSNMGGNVFYDVLSSTGSCDEIDSTSLTLNGPSGGYAWSCGGTSGTAVLSLNPLP